MNTPKRVAIYARVSTEEQSLDSQLHDLREYCRSRDWEATEYLDHGVSGTKDSRPGWNACWDAIQKGKHKVLIVHALDRLGRSLSHLVKIVTYLSERNVSLVSYRESIDLSTAAGRMVVGLFSVMAEYERAIIVERTRSGMRAAKMRGKQIGNKRHWFDKKKAAELRGMGWGQIRIARALGVGVGTVNAWVRQLQITASDPK